MTNIILIKAWVTISLITNIVTEYPKILVPVVPSGGHSSFAVFNGRYVDDPNATERYVKTYVAEQTVLNFDWQGVPQKLTSISNSSITVLTQKLEWTKP